MIDPGIALSVRPVQTENPLELFARLQSIKGQRQQQQVNALSLLSAQRQMDEEDAVKAAVAAAGGDVSKALPAIMQASPKSGIGISKSLAEQKTAQLRQQKTELDIHDRNFKRLGSMAAAVNTPEDLNRFLSEGINMQVLDPQTAQQIAAQGLTTSTMQWLDARTKEAMTVGEQLAQKRFELDGEMKRAENERLAEEAQRKATLFPAQRQKAESDAALAELTAAGKAPIQPGERERIAATKTATERAREEFEERKRHNLIVEGQGATRLASEGTAIELTPAGIDAAAMAFAKSGQLPPMGMGAKAAQARAKIINRAAEMVPNLDVAANRADYDANRASLTQAQKMLDAVAAFESTATKNLDQFVAQAQKIKDFGSPLVNMPLRQAMKMAGNTDMPAYEAARRVALTEIAKVTSNPNLAGVLTDSARKEIEDFNPESATLAQTLAVAKVLKQDMANRKSELSNQVGAIKGRISGGGGQKPTHRFNPATGKIEAIGGK